MADRLVYEGVEIVLDQYHLDLGDDSCGTILYQFTAAAATTVLNMAMGGCSVNGLAKPYVEYCMPGQ